jgi:hypothetical protein
MLLIAIEILFFLLNFKLGKFYANSDVTLVELHPYQQLVEVFSIWQSGRGFGLELGEQIGWVIPLSFFTILSFAGLNALQIDLINNFSLFIGPGLATFVLARTIFYRDVNRNAIAFFAGLLTVTSFSFMILAAFPLLSIVWPTIVVPLMLSSMLMIFQTGEKRYWLALVSLCYINWASFIAPNFLIFPLVFAVAYVFYYLVFESSCRRRNMIQVALGGLIFLTSSLPIIYSIVHLTFLSSFFQSPFLIQYTAGDLLLNQSGKDNSALIYGIRLIGSLSWSEILSWTGEHYKAYYEIFTLNPIFIASSFLLPLTAFASLCWKNNKTGGRILFLAAISLVTLFFLKGVQPPVGSIFLWLIRNVSLFAAFREPFNEIAPTLCYSMSILGAYTLVRIFQASRHKRNLLARIAAVAVIVALVIDAYPQYTGEVSYPAGFFSLPNYYQSIAASINSNSSIYKILGLPETYYVNCYTWGYCGDGIDGVNLNKPVILDSYIGSDVYDEAMMNAILNEVKYNSVYSYTTMSWGDSPGIFSNTNNQNESINLDRLAYFAYLLRSSNVGQLMLRQDSTGALGGPLVNADWYKYDAIFSALINMSLIHQSGQFGNLTLYDVNNAEPMVYSSSAQDIFSTNSYADFLDSTYTDSRLHILSSYFGYNQSIGFVSSANTNFNVLNATEADLIGPYIYAPISVNDYLNQVNNEITLENGSVTPAADTIQELTSLKEALVNNDSPSENTYVDYIQQPGNFSFFIRASPLAIQAIQNQSITFNNQRITINATVADTNGWLQVGNVKLNSGSLIINSPILPTTVSTAVCALSNDYVNSYLDSINAPQSVNISNYIITRYQNSSWSIHTSWGGMFHYSSLCSLTSDSQFDPNFIQSVVQAFGLNLGSTTPGPYFGAQSSDYDILLISNNNTSIASTVPSLSFDQLSSTEYLVNVHNATSPFFLNFLESYNPNWKLSLVSSNTSFSAASGFINSGVFSAISGKSVSSQTHYLLNGFANTWYVNPSNMTKEGLVKSENGSYNFVLLISYLPEAYFVVMTTGSMLGVVVILSLIFRVEIVTMARKYVVKN